MAAEINLRTKLKKHLGQRTVLGVLIPVLEGTSTFEGPIEEFAGVTEREIEARFRALSADYNGSAYHSTYLHRRLGPRGYLEEANGLYRIQNPLLLGMQKPQLEEIVAELLGSVKSEFERREEVILRLERSGSLPDGDIDGRLAIVDQYLSELTGNRGETFEVISYAILKEYFRALGFALRRFSTTHANDGGMDFVAGEAIYQVSVNESFKKLEEDLVKCPGTNRVLVRPTEVSEFIKLSSRGVLATIDAKDLLSHFAGWLVSRDTMSRKAMHLQNVIMIAIEELRRENRAQTNWTACNQLSVEEDGLISACPYCGVDLPSWEWVLNCYICGRQGCSDCICAGACCLEDE